MPVARFCVCGFLLPASHDPTRPCPACGKFSASPMPKIDAAPPKLVDANQPLTFQAVELDSDGAPIPYLGPPQARSIKDDDDRRRRAEVYRAISDENRRHVDIRRRQENNWPAPGSLQDCFTYPLKSIVWVLILAWSWSIVLILGIHFGAHGWDYLVPDAILAAAAVIVLGFTHRLCQYAYASSSAGQNAMLSWPSFNFMAELKAGLTGLVGLLAGPIPVASLAMWFWLYSGRIQAVDRLILIELVTVALTWWLLIILSSHEFGSIHPLSIVRWFESRGWLPLAAAVGAMTVVTLILWFMSAAVTAGPTEGVFVQAIFLPASLVWVFAILFLVLRWLGVRTRVEAPNPVQPSPQI